jgi:hypothetical protein
MKMRPKPRMHSGIASTVGARFQRARLNIGSILPGTGRVGNAPLPYSSVRFPLSTFPSRDLLLFFVYFLLGDLWAVTDGTLFMYGIGPDQ